MQNRCKKRTGLPCFVLIMQVTVDVFQALGQLCADKLNGLDVTADVEENTAREALRYYQAHRPECWQLFVKPRPEIKDAASRCLRTADDVDRIDAPPSLCNLFGLLSGNNSSKWIEKRLVCFLERDDPVGTVLAICVYQLKLWRKYKFGSCDVDIGSEDGYNLVLSGPILALATFSRAQRVVNVFLDAGVDTSVRLREELIPCSFPSNTRYLNYTKIPLLHIAVGNDDSEMRDLLLDRIGFKDEVTVNRICGTVNTWTGTAHFDRHTSWTYLQLASSLDEAGHALVVPGTRRSYAIATTTIPSIIAAEGLRPPGGVAGGLAGGVAGGLAVGVVEGLASG